MVQAAKHGVSINGADIYTTFQPCVLCTKLLINAGIKRVFFLYPYPDSLALEMAAEAELELIQLELPNSI